MAKQKNLYRDHHFNQIKTGWNVVSPSSSA